MRWLAGLLMVWAGAAAAAEPVRLAPLPALDRAAVTVSGLSSGAFFAHQFHVAHSQLVTGAGLVAGGPYACAEQTDEPFWLSAHPYARTVAAVTVCTRMARSAFQFWSDWWGALPEAPAVERSIEATSAAWAAGAIDNPANLAGHRVWLFSGSRDSVVPGTTVATLAGYYQRVGVTGDRLTVVDDVPAGHGLPVAAFDGESRFRKLDCGDQEPPFIVDCDFVAAERLLRHLYAGALDDRPAEPVRERLLAFDQTDFFDPAEARSSLSSTGYVYVPEACAAGAAATGSCRLHVAFHGCSQNVESVDDDFVWDGGYNRWAEANAVVVLYPQTAPWTPAWDPLGWGGNPKACWDWWGYTGEGYSGRGGLQMAAVRAMIARLLAD